MWTERLVLCEPKNLGKATAAMVKDSMSFVIEPLPNNEWTVTTRHDRDASVDKILADAHIKVYGKRPLLEPVF